MSFGLSPSDIAQGIQLAKYIHDTFFTDVNRAGMQNAETWSEGADFLHDANVVVFQMRNT